MFVLSVGLSVGLLETGVYFGRMATEMPFGLVGGLVQEKICIKWGS